SPGDQCVDVATLAGRGTLRALLVHRCGGTSDPEDPQQIPHEGLRLTALVPLSVTPLRDERPSARPDVGQHERFLTHTVILPGSRPVVSASSCPSRGDLGCLEGTEL